jgi:hypothetical protein
MTMRDVGKNIVVTLIGLMATVIVFHLIFEAYIFSTEQGPHVLLGLLLVFLLCIPSLGIGYFATRFPILQSAFVLFAGQMIVTMMDYAPAIYPGRHILPREAMFYNMRQDLVFVGVACILAYLGAWLRNRVNQRRERNSDAAPH